MLLRGKIAVITGGASGIGLELCRGFAREGATVAVLDLQDPAPALAKLREQGLSAQGYVADVTHFESVEDAVAEIMQKNGRVDVLVNNAGLYGGSAMERAPFEQITEAGWDRMMAVNVKGVWNTTRAVSPHMRRRKSGKIVNISSSSIFHGSQNMLHYVASKGAVFSMSRALARELGSDGINVNTITPGLTMTKASEEMLERAGLQGREKQVASVSALGRVQYPADVVGTAIFLGSSLSDAITGQTVNVDGGHVHW